MKDYSFAYGSGTVNIPLEEDQVTAVLDGNDIPPIPDIRAAVRESLETPIGCAPLCACVKPGDTVFLSLVVD